MSRNDLVERLPEIWGRLDKDGTLERYLGVWDDELNRIHGLVQGLLKLRTIDEIPDRYLRIIGALVGHQWEDDRSRAWNRSRIRQCISRYSYKGTLNRLGDDLSRLGATGYAVQDNASKLLVLGKQGRLSRDDAYLVTADYWHDGAFVLRSPRSVDYTDVCDVIAGNVPAGERWYFSIFEQIDAIFEASWAYQCYTIHPSTNSLLGALGYGIIGGQIFLSFEPNGAVAKSSIAYMDGVAGGYLTIDSTVKVDRTDIAVDDGTPENPLSPSTALDQDDPQKTSIDL